MSVLLPTLTDSSSSITDSSDSPSTPVSTAAIDDSGLADAFTTAEIPDGTLKDSLIERFDDNLVSLISILQVLAPAATALAGHTFVDGQRLGNILSGVTKFDCGKQQLLDFAQSCKTNNLTLSFVTPNETSPEVSDYYALQSSKLLEQNRVIYVSVNPQPPTEDERYIGKLNLATRKILIEKLQIHSLISQESISVTLEGYKVGHELSHATAWIKHFEKMKQTWNTFIAENQSTIGTIFDSIKDNPDIGSIPERTELKLGGRNLTLKFWKDMFNRFYNPAPPNPTGVAIAKMKGSVPEHPLMSQCLNDAWQREKYKPLEGLDSFLVRNLFSNPEEARNLLGLGLEKRFSAQQDIIIGEFQFLKELVQRFEGTNTVCVRMPYGILANSLTEEQKALNAMLTRDDIRTFIIQIFAVKFEIEVPLTLENPKQIDKSDSCCIVC
ncbi:MAG: hypothetical protein LBD69_02005 [Puniceicoccales bacterium]|jgi:hypothetical protein|nr:hypothetical protein [Puniceicoccales bacterium]